MLSGGQRIHHAPLLEQRMISCGIDPDSMRDYVDGFRWGCPPVSDNRFRSSYRMPHLLLIAWRRRRWSGACRHALPQAR